MITNKKLLLILMLASSVTSSVLFSSNNACCLAIGKTEAGAIVKAASIGDLDTVAYIVGNNINLLDQAISLAAVHSDSATVLTLHGVKKLLEENINLKNRHYQDQEIIEKLAREVHALKRFINNDSILIPMTISLVAAAAAGYALA